jgi:hypothetical protein
LTFENLFGSRKPEFLKYSLKAEKVFFLKKLLTNEKYKN